MATNKISSTYRFSGNTKRMLAHLARLKNTTKTRILEMLIRKAHKEGMSE